MTESFHYHAAFATSESKDLSALKRFLPGQFSLERCATPQYEIKTPVDILLLDFTHRIGSTDEILRHMDITRPKHAVILAAQVSEVESFPLASNPVDRIFRHPQNPRDYKTLAGFLSDMADPNAEKKLSKAEFNKESNMLEVRFGNGQFYKFPPIIIEGLDSLKIKRVRISRSRHEMIIEQASGPNLTIPWDFIRHHCDPGYAYYRQKQDPTLAGRIARNIKALRAQKNISSYELASRTGIQRPNIARIETAKTNPNLTTLDKIAQALQVSPLRLLE